MTNTQGLTSPITTEIPANRDGDVWLVGPEGCFERECEDYFDDNGHDLPQVAYCSHIRTTDAPEADDTEAGV